MIRLSHHIIVWVGIVVVLVLLLFLYPMNIGTKKLLLPTVENSYVSGVKGSTIVPLGPLYPKKLVSGYNEGSFVPYLKFDLSPIPKSSNLVDVNVDSAELKMLASSATGNQTKFFITVNSCDKNNWFKNITYDTRVCPNTLKGQDSIVVNASSLPQITRWDVSNTVINATKQNKGNITFAITAVTVSKDRDISEIIAKTQQTNDAVVVFWSSEESAKSVTAMPTLVVSMVTTPKPIVNYLSTGIAVVLPIVGILLILIPRK